MTFRRIATVLAVLGAALVLVGIGVGTPGIEDLGIEGAYFTRASGTPAYSGVFTAPDRLLELPEAADGNLWMGAGLAYLVAAGVLVGVGLVQERRGPDS